MEYYELIKNWDFTGTMGIWTYWIPLVLCAIGYSYRTYVQIQDIKRYSKDKHAHYVPDLTVGTIVWRMFLTVTPIVNILSFSFSILEDMVRKLCNGIEWVMAVKLVKK